jgi:aryl-alcohol dehydrogenase-like predicted oxidoreductase
MDAIANDYEELGMIVDEVSAWAAERGISVTPEEILTALTGLVQTGLAKAYRLSSSHPPEEIHGLHRIERQTDYYFLLTPEGKRAIRDY